MSSILGWVNTTRKVNFVRLKWTSDRKRYKLVLIKNLVFLYCSYLWIRMKTYTNLNVWHVVLARNNQYTNCNEWTTLSIRAENQICSTTLIYATAWDCFCDKQVETDHKNDFEFKNELNFINRRAWENSKSWCGFGSSLFLLDSVKELGFNCCDSARVYILN